MLPNNALEGPLAIDRSTREWAVAQRSSQLRAAEAAYELLYRSERHHKL